MSSRIIILISLVCLMLGIAGCGGGGNSSTNSAAARKTSSVVNLPTSLTQPIGGLQLTLNFPPGITVDTDTNGQPLGSVVQLSGGPASLVTAVKYVPATAVAGGTLKLIVTDVNGFVAGESVSITMNIVSGQPAKSDFSVTDITISDLNGVTLTGLPEPVFTIDKS